MQGYHVPCLPPGTRAPHRHVKLLEGEIARVSGYFTVARNSRAGGGANDEAAQLRRASPSCYRPWAESAVAAAWRAGLSWRLGNCSPTAATLAPCGLG